jgi:hypothetical protein
MAEMVVVFPPKCSSGAQLMLLVQRIPLCRLYVVATSRLSISVQLTMLWSGRWVCEGFESAHWGMYLTSYL